MSGMTKAERLTEMKRLYIQRAYSDIELAERLDVARETVYRDRIELTAEYPVEKGEDGRYRINRSKLISEIKVNLHEALTLYLAARKTSRQTRYYHPHAASAVEKLAGALRQPMTGKLLKVADAVLKQERNPEKIKIIETLAQAWVEQYKVRIRYQGLKSVGVTNHLIRPYLIEPSIWSDSLYVVAYSETFEKTMPFKIDRIDTAALSSEPFEIPENFDEEELLKHAWGIWYGDQEPVTVILRFNEQATRRVKESIWHPLERVEATENGGCLWSAEVAEWREMLPWIRGWGADVEVLEPNRLRMALEREIQRLAKVYGVEQVENLDHQYYAHTKDDVDESEWQLLKDHLIETANKAFELGEDAGISEIARAAGFLHDIGKYSEEFQARLRGSNKRVDHATAGAREVMKLFPESPQKDFAELLSYCIAGHHSGLPDYGSKIDVETDGTLLARREKKNIKKYDAYKQDIDTVSLEITPRQITPARFRLNGKETPYLGFSISFLTRMLFSTLTDADWLDTERFVQGDTGRGQHASIEELTDKFNSFLARFENPTNEINRKRTETLQACIARSNQEPGFFKLTVPTGGGKTFASMAFALNHAKKKGLKRIIYVIPFTSIIEQNADEFRKALGALGQENILEHHSNFDWEGKRRKRQKKNPMTKRISSIKSSSLPPRIGMCPLS